MNKNVIIIAYCGLLIFYSCSASTGSRYENKKEEKESVTNKENKSGSKIVEDFDFTPYKTKLDIPKKEVKIPTLVRKSEIWYGYEEKEIDTTSFLNRNIIDKLKGYRILVLATDNLDEANNMRSEIHFNVTQKEIYVIFDPPFYKVLIGDFLEYSEAKDFSFRLNQLGYNESRVVSDTVNVFEQ